MLNEDIRSWEDLGFVAVFPAHEIGRRSVLAKHFDYLCVALWLSQMMPANNQAIPWFCAQRRMI